MIPMKSFEGLIKMRCSCGNLIEIAVYKDHDDVIQLKQVYEDDDGVYQFIEENGRPK